MYKIEILFEDFEILVENKRVIDMSARPERADLYIGLDNNRTLKNIQDKIANNISDIQINFYRITHINIPKPIVYPLNIPNEEIPTTLDVCYYAYSNSNNRDEIEQYVKSLHRQFDFSRVSVKAEEYL